MAGMKTRGRGGRWLLPVALLGAVALMSLAGCGLPGASAFGGSPPDAATILQRTQSAKITDVSFTLTGTLTASLDPNTQGLKASFDGTGKMTISPKRGDFALNVDANSNKLPIEVITDSSGDAGYLNLSSLLAQLGVPAGYWLKLPLGSVANYVSDPTAFTNFMQITKPTLVGSETLNGVSVYHLEGQQQAASVATATEDFYVRQDNYYPVRVDLHGNAVAVANATLNFTAVNSGLNIDLPSQVIGG